MWHQRCERDVSGREREGEGGKKKGIEWVRDRGDGTEEGVEMEEGEGGEWKRGERETKRT